MPTIPRSPRPTCPACGFAVFNRRCAKCERCQAVLPTSVAYTEAEMIAMRQTEGLEEEARRRRAAKARAERARHGFGTAFRPDERRGGDWLDVVDLGIDLGDLGGD